MADGKSELSELIENANLVLSGKNENPLTIYGWAKTFASENSLDYACRLANLIKEDESLEPSVAVDVRQKLAMWTSKNPDTPDDTKHDEALNILDSVSSVDGISSLKDSDDPETLGIAGGITKRKWLVDGLDSTLEKSLNYYKRGSEFAIETTLGYPEINAAFVLDLLNHIDGSHSAERAETARKYREKVLELEALADTPSGPDRPPLKQERWFHETLAEAYFGLHRYNEATVALQNAYKQGNVKPWELETTARQFSWLARIHEPNVETLEEYDNSAAWGVLREVYGSQAKATAGSLFGGKLGLALSGGGFRASLYHIGVLASLAEKDLLRHVEVLSCVSGGSILGAHYYLEVRKLLEETEDGHVTQQDYIDLVDRLATDFLTGIQQNIRMRVADSLKTNLLMMFKPGYTRTNRLGELYETYLYHKVEDDKKRMLKELQIRPKGDENIKPKYDNWKRENKVPILVINCTTLNTGHNWQFTTSWMGEPPNSINSEIDTNERLRRMYLDTEAPEPHGDISISTAAAASSCVPGLFTPLELRGLYPDRIVRLVDGGVHDNQGVMALLDQNCSVMLVSDASGQMQSESEPKDNPLGVLLRSSGVLSSRIRAAIYREIDARKKTGRLKDLLFLHLKQDLQSDAVDWEGCNNPKSRSSEDKNNYFASHNKAGVLKKYQKSIANIRTDLDSFSDTEAYALMASGYLMTNDGLQTSLNGFSRNEQSHEWSFLSTGKALSDNRQSDLHKILEAGSSTLFKVWKLSKPLLYTSRILGVGLLVLLGYIFWNGRGAELLSVGGIASAVSFAVFGIVLGRFGLQKIFNLLNYQKTVNQVGSGVVLSVVGFVSSWVHLKVFDKLFLKKGKVVDSEQRDS